MALPTPQAPPDQPTHPGFQWGHTVVSLVLPGLAAQLLLPQLAELQRSIDIVRHMVWWALGLAGLSQGLSYLGGALVL